MSTAPLPASLTIADHRGPHVLILCGATGIRHITHLFDTPQPNSNDAWPASVYPRGGGLSRRCITARRPRRLAESPRCPMRWQAQRLDVATWSGTRPNGETCPTALPQMSGTARLSSVTGRVAQVASSVRHGDRSAHPPATARHVTVDSDRLACPHGDEQAVTGAQIRHRCWDA